MLNVKISIEENGKKAEICLSEADNLSKLVIIQNVFNLFGIDTDVLEMTKMFNNVGKAYSDFFNQVNPIETTKDEIETKSEDIRNQLIEGLTIHKDELEETYHATTDQPDFVYSGIKIRPDGTKTYKLHYKCEACWNTGNHYVYETSKVTWCHRCQHEMKVIPATPQGFGFRDTFGNYFVAGEFRDWNVWNN